MTNPIAPGTAGLVKHVSSHSSSTRYEAVTVTRTTKARVFARASYEGAPEREFRLDNMRQYGEKTWRADELIVDPAALEKIARDQESEQARRSLERRALVAISDLRALFEGHKVHNRSEAEIEALCDLRGRLCTPADVSGG